LEENLTKLTIIYRYNLQYSEIIGLNQFNGLNLVLRF
jgi:hypothetical protein